MKKEKIIETKWPFVAIVKFVQLIKTASSQQPTNDQ